MQSINSNFSAIGSSSEVNGDNCDVLISGTFDGSVSLQVQDVSGNWLTLETWTAAGTSLDNKTAFARNWRLNCSALNSGSVDFEISAGKVRELKA